MWKCGGGGLMTTTTGLSSIKQCSPRNEYYNVQKRTHSLNDVLFRRKGSIRGRVGVVIIVSSVE